MRVLLVSSWFPYPPDNGSKQRAYHLMRELSRLHTVTLLSFAEQGEAGEDHLKVLREICRAVEIVRGHPFKHGRLSLTGLLSTTPRSFVQTHSEQMNSEVERALASCDIAVGLETGSALYLRGVRSVPRVFEGAETTWLRTQSQMARGFGRRSRAALTRWKYNRFIRLLANTFERTTVVSEVERRALLDLGCDPDRVKVVPNGVALADPEIETETRLPRVIYTGSVTYSANYDAVQMFLRDIWPLIRTVRPDLTFMVTGSTDGVDLRGLHPADGVTFTGRVDDVRRLVAESMACVVPLRLGGGTRLKILESMAVRTPVISTSKGAEGLAVTPEQEVLIGDSPRTFANQVLRVLDEPILAARLAGKARALVERLYAWDRIGAALGTALDEAVETYEREARRR